jgi:SulP family sulfate permease
MFKLQSNPQIRLRSDILSGITVALALVPEAVAFAWKHAQVIHTATEIDTKGTKIYTLHGPLFFGSVKSFLDLFDPKNDPDDVVIEFQHTRVSDHSAIEAIDTLADRYERLGKKLHLRHLSSDCQQLLRKAGSMVEVNAIEDPHYHVADDALA